MGRHDNFKERTRAFGVRVVARQLMRCGTSVGANYRAAARARSRADFIAKLGTVEEEADESMYWLDVLRDLGYDSDERTALHRQASERLSIVIASKKTARQQANA